MVTLSDFCQGHGAECTDYYEVPGDCDNDHGVRSYCDGSCASARVAFADDLMNGRVAAVDEATDSITLEVMACDGSARWEVLFEGPDAEVWALAYVTARWSTHAIHEVLDRPFSYVAFPQLAGKLNPLCDHGMSANSCYGPAHFARPEEIAAGW